MREISTVEGERVFYLFSVTHDGFPGHSMFISMKQVHFYDPIRAKETPFPALFPPMEKQTSIICGEYSGSIPLPAAYAPKT